MRAFTVCFVALLMILRCISSSQSREDFPSPRALEIVHILNEDIFAHFDFEDEPSTQLAKKQYLRSSEGRMLLDSIRTLRKFILGRELQTNVEVALGDYDIKRQGFNIEIDKRPSYYGDERDDADYRNSFVPFRYEVNGFWIPQLAIKLSQSIYYLNGIKSLFVGCNEDIGAHLENKNIILQFKFRLTGKTVERTATSVFIFRQQMPLVSNVNLNILFNNEVVIRKKY